MVEPSSSWQPTSYFAFMLHFYHLACFTSLRLEGCVKLRPFWRWQLLPSLCQAPASDGVHVRFPSWQSCITSRSRSLLRAPLARSTFGVLYFGRQPTTWYRCVPAPCWVLGGRRRDAQPTDLGRLETGR